MAGDRIRLFCALQLPDDAVRELVSWREASLPSAGRPVRPEDLHVTLAFLGSRPATEVPVIAEAMRECCSEAQPLDLRPFRYRETRSAGMLVLDDPGGAAAALAATLQERLDVLGVYRREARAWLPHVTLFRFRKPEGLRPDLANMCSLHVVRSALYRSVLAPNGARYDALETAALGGNEDGS